MGSSFQPEKSANPIIAFPLLLVAVARKPPAASAVPAQDMGRWASAPADAVVLACWSFQFEHVSPLTRVLESPPIAKRKRNFDSIDMNAPRYYERLQEEFKRLHALGWTFRQIAEALDVSERTIVAWRDELDLPRRPRGRKPRKARG